MTPFQQRQHMRLSQAIIDCLGEFGTIDDADFEDMSERLTDAAWDAMHPMVGEETVTICTLADHHPGKCNGLPRMLGCATAGN